MSKPQHEIHNTVAPEAVFNIVKPIIDAGGSTDILVALESINVGVLAFIIRSSPADITKSNEVVVDALMERVRARTLEMLAAARFGKVDTEGSA